MATQKEQVELGIKLLVDSGSIDSLTSALTSGVAKATTAGGKRAQEQYAKHLADAMGAAVRRVGEGRAIKDLSGKVFRVEAMQKAIVEAYEKGDTEHAKFLERERKKDMKHLSALAERRKKSFQDYAELQDRTFTQTADDFNEKLSSGISNLFSGNIDIGGLVKKIGAKAQQRGDAAVTRGQSVDASKMEKAMGRMGAGIAKLGSGVMAMGAVAGVLIVLVKAFVDLHDKIAEMNKALAGTSGAADFGLGTAAVRAGEFQKKLDTIRTDILETSSKLSGDNWFISSKDMFTILSGMNEMNYRWDQMEKNVENNVAGLSSFADHALIAVGYGKLLGVEGAQMGQNMAQMANEFGVGLDTIAQGLSMVNKEAMVSGFSTKRFYSTILETTSGLGQYNVRLSEAAGLLSGMGAAMGEARGESLFKGTVGDQSFKGKSPVDALRDILLKGQKGKVANIFGDEAAAAAADFFKAMTEQQRAAFGKRFKLDTSSAQAFGEAFAKAAPDQGALQAALGELQISGEASGFATKAGRLGKAGKGDLDRQTAAYGDLGAAGRLRMMMMMPEFSGHQDMSKLLQEGLTPEIQAVIDAMGISMEQFRELADFQGRLGSEFAALAKVAKDQAEGTIFDRGEFGKFQKTKGGFQKVDASGTAISSVFDDVDSYLAAQNDFIEVSQKEVDENLEAARKMSQETENMSNVLEDNIAKILNNIYIVVRDILNYITGDTQRRGQVAGAGKALMNDLTTQAETAQAALATAQAAHTAAPTTETQAAVDTAQMDVDTQKRLSEAAASIDPSQFSSPSEYKKAVYKKAGVKSNYGSRGASSQEKDLMGQTASEAFQEGGALAGLANVTGFGDSGIETWHQFKSKMDDDVWSQSGGVYSEDQKKAFMDYWGDELVHKIRSNGDTHREATKQEILGNAQGHSKAWGQILSEGTFLNDFNELLENPTAAAAKIAGYQAEKAAASETWNQLASQAGMGLGFDTANDMYVPSNGRPVMLNSADSVLAMKPGGAVDKAMGRGGGNVTINVKNYGNPREVQKAVIRGIKIARGEPFA